MKYRISTLRVNIGVWLRACEDMTSTDTGLWFVTLTESRRSKNPRSHPRSFSRRGSLGQTITSRVWLEKLTAQHKSRRRPTIASDVHDIRKGDDSVRGGRERYRFVVQWDGGPSAVVVGEEVSLG